MNDLFDESEKKRKSQKPEFRSTSKPTARQVEDAAKERKDKRKKRGRTIRFEPHEADVVFDAIKEWAKFLADEKGRQIGAKLERFTDNDVFVWCIKRGIQALEDGERPDSIVSGSLIL